MSYLPKTHNHVSPFLVVQFAEPVIEFLEEVFNAELISHFPHDEGGVVHAELKIKDSVIMIGEGNNYYPPAKSILHIYVPDCDATIQRALDKGATLIREPETFANGDRRGAVIGPQGNTWAVATLQPELE
ncbi:MAG: VOC family protein [Candidatus Kariarchaeaceae archaeon]|jgi:uncharacterized glyoxalase superfamily protein PhnB